MLVYSDPELQTQKNCIHEVFYAYPNKNTDLNLFS